MKSNKLMNMCNGLKYTMQIYDVPNKIKNTFWGLGVLTFMGLIFLGTPSSEKIQKQFNYRGYKVVARKMNGVGNMFIEGENTHYKGVMDLEGKFRGFDEKKINALYRMTMEFGYETNHNLEDCVD